MSLPGCPGRSKIRFMSTQARRFASLLCTAALLAGTTLSAESKNPSDYPLRLHIFNRSQTSFYQHRELEESKGEGRANLFANGEVHAIDFNFACENNLRPSLGFDTYPAKWKKPGKELVVLLPVFGKSGSFFTCNLQTDVKDFAYYSRNGQINQETSADFKAWMVKHQYDPEHGKNEPTREEAKPLAK